MKRIPNTYKTLTVIAGVTGIVLQSYIFICGCSSPANPVDPAELSAKRLYSAKCASCHNLLPPEDYTYQEWRYYVDKYGKKMSDLEKQQVLNYLEKRAASAEED